MPNNQAVIVTLGGAVHASTSGDDLTDDLTQVGGQSRSLWKDLSARRLKLANHSRSPSAVQRLRQGRPPDRVIIANLAGIPHALTSLDVALPRRRVPMPRWVMPRFVRIAMLCNLGFMLMLGCSETVDNGGSGGATGAGGHATDTHDWQWSIVRAGTTEGFSLSDAFIHARDGIQLVDYAVYGGSYTNTRVRRNAIDAAGAVIRIGMGMGWRVWVCLDPASSEDPRIYGAL